MGETRTEQFLYEDETFRIRDAIFEVYRTMGPGFLEAVYQECLTLEFNRRGVTFDAMKPLKLQYRNEILQQTYVPDFICFEQIIIELKAIRTLAPEHRAPTINYLRAANMRLGLLVNFGARQGVEIERFAL